MPNTHSTLTSLFSDIADAIRGKTGSSATIVADDFPTAIASIPTGGGSATIEPLSITANGTYTAPSGVDGYSPITVNVPKNAVTTTEEPNSTGTTLYINSTSESSWTRPSDWPDLSKMDVSGGNILYMTSYADEARGFCSFVVYCTGSYTVEVGTISGSTFTAESTQTFANASRCNLYYGSAIGGYKVLRVTGTNINAFSNSGDSVVTIDTFYGMERCQGIIDIVGNLPSCTSFSCSSRYNLINVEVSNLILSGAVNGVFSNDYSLTHLDVSSWNTSAVTSMATMFSGCYSLTSLNLSNWNTSAVTKMNSMFQNDYALTSLNLSGWDTSGVTSMATMFSGCYSLTSLDVSGWDTSAVTTMGSMFYNCDSLTYLDVSGWDTSAVTNMSGMFQRCASLTYLDVSGWDTSAVTNMNTMFNYCYSLTNLDVSGWDTSGVTDMSNMFYYCYSLTNLDVSDWDTSAVTTMTSMFYSDYSLTNLDVSSWDTSAVQNMSAMFYNCTSCTNLDVSDWDTSTVTNMSSMFYNCTSLTNLDISSWDFSKITATTSTNSMFSTCYGLHGSLTLPSSLAYIGSNCFTQCRSLYEWHFLATTPPTLASTNAFDYMANFGGKKIYVPAASLTAYQTATNWSTYASYMVGE